MTLPEPNPAVLACLADEVFGVLPKWDQAKAYEYGRATHGTDVTQDVHARVQLFLPAILYLYDALIEWMGPGGDAFFLDMYLVAHGSLPPFEVLTTRTTNATVGGIYQDSNGVNHDSIEHMRASDRRAREGLQSKTTGPVFFDVLSPRMEIFHFHGKAACFVSFAAQPTKRYREDLMGELAEPWPDAGEGGWNPYVYLRPSRHVLPLDRPYDESGYLYPA